MSEMVSYGDKGSLIFYDNEKLTKAQIHALDEVLDRIEAVGLDDKYFPAIFIHSDSIVVSFRNYAYIRFPYNQKTGKIKQNIEVEGM